MRMSLALLAEMAQEFNVCVFDVTRDSEGTPAGGGGEHAAKGCPRLWSIHPGQTRTILATFTATGAPFICLANAWIDILHSPGPYP